VTPFEGWSDLSAFLKSISTRHQDSWVSPTGHASIRFAYSFRGAELGLFFVHNKQEDGNDWFYIGVRGLPVGSFDLAEVVANAPRGAVGALALAADFLCVGQTLPISGLDRTHVMSVIDRLCELAQELEKLARPVDARELFQYFVD
jgi:hypothetical protein